MQFTLSGVFAARSGQRCRLWPGKPGFILDEGKAGLQGLLFVAVTVRRDYHKYTIALTVDAQ